MRIKLDENLGLRARALFLEAGHDVSTVREQALGGAPDERIFDVCAREGRALVTLDRDFGQVLRFPPSESHGLVVLALRGRPDHQEIAARVHDFLAALATRDLGRELWIVEEGRVRIHEAAGD